MKKKHKTIKDYIICMPKVERDLYLKELIKQRNLNRLNHKCSSFRSAIDMSFKWSSTSQGHGYWERISSTY